MVCINAKLKMHKNANSKCTIMVMHSVLEYTPNRRCADEREKGHFREGEIHNERKQRNQNKLLKVGTTT